MNLFEFVKQCSVVCARSKKQPRLISIDGSQIINILLATSADRNASLDAVGVEKVCTIQRF